MGDVPRWDKPVNVAGRHSPAGIGTATGELSKAPPEVSGLEEGVSAMVGAGRLLPGVHPTSGRSELCVCSSVCGPHVPGQREVGQGERKYL